MREQCPLARADPGQGEAPIGPRGGVEALRSRDPLRLGHHLRPGHWLPRGVGDAAADAVRLMEPQLDARLLRELHGDGLGRSFPQRGAHRHPLRRQPQKLEPPLRVALRLPLVGKTKSPTLRQRLHQGPRHRLPLRVEHHAPQRGLGVDGNDDVSLARQLYQGAVPQPSFGSAASNVKKAECS